MNNLIKADLYRTKKYKSLYVVAIVCFVFVLLSALLYRGIDFVAQNMIDTSVPMGDASAGDVSQMLSQTFGSGTALSTAIEILKSDTLIYSLIAIFIVVSALEFSSGTIKNSLTYGIKRKDIYFSKLITSIIYTLFYYIVFFVSAILCSMLVYWQTIPMDSILDLLFIGLKQLPIYIGIIAAGHCFVFMTQSTVGSVALYIVSFMIFNTILPMFNMILGWDMNVTLLFPLYQCIELTNTDISAINYATIYGSTLVYIELFIWFGYYKFKKSEIK